MDTIKSHARKARVALKEVLETPPSAAEPMQQDLREAHDNFLLWAVNLGVFDSGHSNLDYKLQEVPEATDLIKDLLEDLVENAEALVSIASGDDLDTADAAYELADDDESGSTGTPDSEDDMDETEARILSLKDIMLRLFRLARSIRNYSTRSSQGHRNIYSTYPLEQRPAIVNYLIDIERLRITDYIMHLRRQNNSVAASTATRGPVEKTIDATSSDLDESEQVCNICLDDEDQALITRLANASSRRRQQFVYWRHRHERSAMAAELGEDQHEEAAAKPDDARIVAVADRSDPLADRPQALSMPSSATKLRRDQINLAERVSVASGISRPPSARGPGGAPVEWPSIPQGLPDGSYFTCPYCYSLCPDRYRSTVGWKSHLMHDLKPYCCTYPHCESGEQLYDSWADWTSHEMLIHNKVWTCLEHPDEEFRTPELYHEHVRNAHPYEAEHMQTPEILSARATGSNWSGRDCPFCFASYEHARELHRHIAWHLESIALAALPRSTGLEQGSQEGIDRNSAAQDLGDADSRAGQFEGSSLPGNEEESPILFFRPIQEHLDKLKATTRSVIPDAEQRACTLTDLIQTIGSFIETTINTYPHGIILDHGSREERLWNYVSAYWPDGNTSGRDLHSEYLSNINVDNEIDPKEKGRGNKRGEVFKARFEEEEREEREEREATERAEEERDLAAGAGSAAPEPRLYTKPPPYTYPAESSLDGAAQPRSHPAEPQTSVSRHTSWMSGPAQSTDPVLKWTDPILRGNPPGGEHIPPPPRTDGTAGVMFEAEADDLRASNTTSSDHKSHEAVSNDGHYICGDCGKPYQLHDQLKHHLDNTGHKGTDFVKGHYTCYDCGKHYQLYDQFEGHLDETGHTGSRPLIEAIAELQDARRSQLEAESEVHYEDYEWEAQRENFIRYCKDDNKTLQEVTQCMIDNHGFYATPGQWERKLRDWGVDLFLERSDSDTIQVDDDRNLRQFSRREKGRSPSKPKSTPADQPHAPGDKSTSIASAIIEGLGAILIILQQSAHPATASTELSGLQVTIRTIDQVICTATQLLRSNTVALDAELCAGVERSIESVERILVILRDKVEVCRQDLEIRGIVGWRNRKFRLGVRMEEFRGMLAPLSQAMSGLNHEIALMHSCIRLSATAGNFPAPSGRGAKSLEDDEHAEGDEDRLTHQSVFPQRLTTPAERMDTVSLGVGGSTTTLADDTISTSSWVRDVEDSARDDVAAEELRSGMFESRKRERRRRSDFI